MVPHIPEQLQDSGAGRDTGSASRRHCGRLSRSVLGASRGTTSYSPGKKSQTDGELPPQDKARFASAAQLRQRFDAHAGTLLDHNGSSHHLAAQLEVKRRTERALHVRVLARCKPTSGRASFDRSLQHLQAKDFSWHPESAPALNLGSAVGAREDSIVQAAAGQPHLASTSYTQQPTGRVAGLHGSPSRSWMGKTRRFMFNMLTRVGRTGSTDSLDSYLTTSPGTSPLKPRISIRTVSQTLQAARQAKQAALLQSQPQGRRADRRLLELATRKKTMVQFPSETDPPHATATPPLGPSSPTPPNASMQEHVVEESHTAEQAVVAQYAEVGTAIQTANGSHSKAGKALVAEGHATASQSRSIVQGAWSDQGLKHQPRSSARQSSVHTQQPLYQLAATPSTSASGLPVLPAHITFAPSPLRKSDTQVRKSDSQIKCLQQGGDTSQTRRQLFRAQTMYDTPPQPMHNLTPQHLGHTSLAGGLNRALHGGLTIPAALQTDGNGQLLSLVKIAAAAVTTSARHDSCSSALQPAKGGILMLPKGR